MNSQKLKIDGVLIIIPEEKFKNPNLEYLCSYQITGYTRGTSERHDIVDPETKILEFVFEDNSTWLSDNDNLDELFPDKPRGDRAIGEDFFNIPSGLSTGGQRDIFSTIALKIINVFAKKAINNVVGIGVKKIAQNFEEKQLGTPAGLYTIGQNFQLSTPIFNHIPKHYFLFIHGTFSSTSGSFEELKNTEVWNYLNTSFSDRILSFQHETLSKSPLENVIDLVKLLPDDVSLTLMTHSRGGLVGDILSKYANGQPFGQIHLDLLQAENRQKDIAAIEVLNGLFVNKKIKIVRYIRVCCPASGTILASGRMTNLLNVTLNLIGITNPFFSLFKELVTAVIESKDNQKALPGLEAMDPESPFIKILNDQSPNIEIEDNLVVLSACSQTNLTLGGLLSLKGLITVVARLFYRQRNDLVVNTDSMYWGAKRKKIQYFFEENTNVTHVTIFELVTTQNRIITILKTELGQKILDSKQFAQNEIPESDRNINLNAILPYGSIKNDVASGKKPILILIPGIMGSTLEAPNDTVWINYLKFLNGGLVDLNISNSNLKASGIVRTAYNQIYNRLTQTYDVITYYYDWRKSVEESAQNFAQKIEELLLVSAKNNQPIKVIAHSLGGVLFRDFIINHNEVWLKLNKNNGFRAVFLGTPFGGSMRMASVLMGHDALIKKLSKIDLHHTKNQLISVFNQLPGVIGLLPLENTSSENDFSDINIWRKFQSASEDKNVPIPTTADLANFKIYRNKVNEKTKLIDFSNMAYIAGKGNETANTYETIPTLKFIPTDKGDESVTWEHGIPKQLSDSNSVYYVQVVHGELANEPKIFDGIEDLLIYGSTNKLDKNPNRLRSINITRGSINDASFDISEKGIEATILGLGGDTYEGDEVNNLYVKISNGDLKYTEYPLIAGHFYNDGILNAERVIDKHLKNILTIRNELMLYPELIGQNEIFMIEENANNPFEFKGAIIVGLGKIGELSRANLTHTIEKAALKYMLNLNTNNTVFRNQKIGLSSLLIGCGYGGLSLDGSAQSIIKGIQNANAKIKSLFQNNTIIISELEFIERNYDKAISAFYSLAKDSEKLHISFSNNTIKIHPGAKKRIIIESQEEWWNRFTVNLKKKDKPTDLPEMAFSLSTKGATQDVRTVSSGTDMLDEFIKSISKKREWNPETAHTIFELMIPNDFKENLKNKGSIAWILDKETAKYPWELIKDPNDDEPFAIHSGMIRQLSTSDTPQNINYITTKSAIVIADPDLENENWQLPGAKKEGELMADIFEKSDLVVVNKLINRPVSQEIIRSIFPNKYKIIHLAGHGVFDEVNPENSGMLIGKNRKLTAAQLAQMSNIPEFVFINCCHLGNVDTNAELYTQNKYKLAANIGTQLINNGVKAVIAAGWEVDDNQALVFAKTFYNCMFEGCNFGDAVKTARKAIYPSNSNTWGAYQCYGDPFYKFDLKMSNSSEEFSYSLSIEAELDLENMLNGLETGDYTTDYALDILTKIAIAVKKANLRTIAITELEAQIYAELGEYETACRNYERLLKEEKADFSVKSMEKYCNVKTKALLNNFDKNDKNRQDSIDKINIVIAKLDSLISFSPTSERHCILASAYKRKGYVLENEKDKIEAYQKSIDNYKEADRIKPSTYPFGNFAPLEILLGADKKAMKKIEEKNIAYLEKFDKKTKNKDYKDFWSLVEENNIKLVDLMLFPEKLSEELVENFKKLWGFTGAIGRKITEKEQLKILIDVCKVSKKSTNESKLKEILEGWVE